MRATGKKGCLSRRGLRGVMGMGMFISLSASCGPPKQADTVADEKAKEAQKDDPVLPKAWSGAPTQEESQKGKFDEEQVTVIMTRAAKNAHTCIDVVGKDQPHGDGMVTVTFSGKGKSTAATIDAPFDGTPMGQCATRAFVNQIVSPFDGPDQTRKYKVDLKADAKGTKK
jgi:hypothetical protein